MIKIFFPLIILLIFPASALLPEICTGMIALVLLLIYSVLIPLIKKNYFLDSKFINLVAILLISTFVISNILNSVNLSNEYIYKTSSYIWSFGALAIGYYILNERIFELKNVDVYFSFFGLFVIYLFSTRGISENTQNFFLNY